jgi:N-acetylglucosaminyldiphosphoundecaprenol N-acetyl-beta-D-mannosaminyltransferase
MMSQLTAECAPASLSILGSQVSVFDSYDDVLQLIKQRIWSRQPTFCVAINPEKVYRAKHDARLKQVLEATHIQLCDGVGISIAARLLHKKRVARCTGIDVFLRLLGAAEQEQWKVFLFGASPEVNGAAYTALSVKFPNLKIVGREHGYVKDSTAVVDSINRSEADLLFVAMGSPRQEFWIDEHLPRLNATFCMGVGGSFDVVSGTARRAPAPFRKTGTEWLYRLLVQPSRLRRQVALPAFALGVLSTAIRRR